MPLITAPKSQEKKPLRVRMREDIYQEIQDYCKWTGIKKIDHFLEEAALLVFDKDKEWKAYQQNNGQSA